MQLTQRGLGLRLAVIAAPAGQRPLCRGRAGLRRAGSTKTPLRCRTLASRERDRDRGSLEDGRRLLAGSRLNAAQSSAIFRRVTSSNERAIVLDYNSPALDETPNNIMARDRMEGNA